MEEAAKPENRPPARSSLKLFRTAVALAVFATAVAYFVGQMRAHADALLALPISSISFSALAFCLLLDLLLILVDTVASIFLLHSCGEPLGFRKGWIVFSLSQFAKYIPGNIAQPLGRLALAKRYGADPPRVMFALFIEMICAVVAGALTMIAALTMSTEMEKLTAATGMPRPDMLLMLALLALITLGLSALFLNRFRPNLVKRFIDRRFVLPKPTAVAIYLSSQVLGFVLLGLVAYIVAVYAFGGAPHAFVLMPSILAAAWLAGFLVPGAPAGLGVREAILIAILGRLFGPGVALGTAIATRLLSTTADGLAFLLGLVVQRTMSSQ